MLIERLLKVALLGSGWVLYLLVGLSILSFSTMFERWIFFLRRRENPNQLQAALRERLRDNDLPGAEKLLSSSRSVEARVALEGLSWHAGGPAAIEDAVDAELARAKPELERGLNLLGTLGNNAPFVGLFGTVLGVIIAVSFVELTLVLVALSPLFVSGRMLPLAPYPIVISLGLTSGLAVVGAAVACTAWRQIRSGNDA